MADQNYTLKKIQKCLEKQEMGKKEQGKKVRQTAQNNRNNSK